MEPAKIEESDITYLSELILDILRRIKRKKCRGLIRTYHLRRTTCSVSDVLI